MARILYVDDEDAIRRAVELWLTRRGHTVQTAADVSSAQSRLQGGRFDAVFIDLWLGKESGLELYDWIRTVDPATGAHVAFVTGDPFDRSLARLDRVRPVFTKPFELGELEAQAISWSVGAEVSPGSLRPLRPGPGDADVRS